MATTFRPSHALDLVQSNLGLLGDLPGTFIGTGFNLIARPDKQNNKPFFLEVNATQEILEFTNIGGDIPNRGSVQDDVTLHGVHYLQRVADCELHSAIHLEPGLWVRVDPTAAPNPGDAGVLCASGYHPARRFSPCAKHLCCKVKHRTNN
jgi:hypothetical protein